MLAANAAVEEIGMSFLPIETPQRRPKIDLAKSIGRPEPKAPAKPVTIAFDAELPTNFDVAISFAGTERALARQLADRLKQTGIAAFYDDFYPEHFWGKNLTAFLDEIYRKRAKFCVVFVSKEYRDRKWTSHEFRSAQARALDAKGEEYILPIKVDETDLDGLPPNIGYVSAVLGIEKDSRYVAFETKQIAIGTQRAQSLGPYAGTRRANDAGAPRGAAPKALFSNIRRLILKKEKGVTVWEPPYAVAACGLSRLRQAKLSVVTDALNAVNRY